MYVRIEYGQIAVMTETDEPYHPEVYEDLARHAEEVLVKAHVSMTNAQMSLGRAQQVLLRDWQAQDKALEKAKNKAKKRPRELTHKQAMEHDFMLEGVDLEHLNVTVELDGEEI